MKTPSAAVRCLLLVVALHLSPTSATTVRRFDLPTLTENAARIFTGVCHSTSSVIVDGRISTRYVFSVRRVVKGEQVDEIDFIVAGGELNGQRIHIAGMPRFQHGEEVVLFLTREDRLGRVWPVGLSQGKLRVHRGASGDDVPREYIEIVQPPLCSRCRWMPAPPNPSQLALSQTDCPSPSFWLEFKSLSIHRPGQMSEAGPARNEHTILYGGAEAAPSCAHRQCRARWRHHTSALQG